MAQKPTPAEVDAIAASLETLGPRAMARLTGERSSAIATYLRLIADAERLSLASIEAADFRRTFNGFYGVRRNADWRGAFYEIFEEAKTARGDATARFAAAARALQARSGRIEASFCSKLVATLEPGAPIIDSVVRGYLAPRIAAPPFGGDLDRAVAYYEWLGELFAQLSRSAPARRWSETFARLPGAEQVHPNKRLDFLIWGGAPRA